jgi:ribosomal protein S18 acetylase RimI-like enzyme
MKKFIKFTKKWIEKFGLAQVDVLLFGTVHGSVVAHLVGENWHIGSVYVDPQYQGYGIGTELMTRTIRHLLRKANRDITLIPCSNGPMTQQQLRAWYIKFGFEATKGRSKMLRPKGKEL